MNADFSPAVTLRSQLVLVAEIFAKAKNLSRSRISTIVFSGGLVLDRLACGQSDINTLNFEKAMRWFSANWPADVAWPADVPRPIPQSQPEEAA